MDFEAFQYSFFESLLKAGLNWRSSDEELLGEVKPTGSPALDYALRGFAIDRVRDLRVHLRQVEDGRSQREAQLARRASEARAAKIWAAVTRSLVLSAAAIDPPETLLTPEVPLEVEYEIHLGKDPRISRVGGKLNWKSAMNTSGAILLALELPWHDATFIPLQAIAERLLNPPANLDPFEIAGEIVGVCHGAKIRFAVAGKFPGLKLANLPEE